MLQKDMEDSLEKESTLSLCNIPVKRQRKRENLDLLKVAPGIDASLEKLKCMSFKVHFQAWVSLYLLLIQW
jgi:hypothetical protein